MSVYSCNVNNSPLFVGIDVGTGSARAGIFTVTGKMLAQASQPIKMWKPKPDFVEQSSDDIWRACCTAMKTALAKAKVRPADIKGIGFDATCSLVALDAHDKPVTVSPSGKGRAEYHRLDGPSRDPRGRTRSIRRSTRCCVMSAA